MVLELKAQRESGAPTLALRGELDIAEASRVDRELRLLDQDRPDRIILDLRDLSFMDSSGLRLILSTYQRLAADGRRLQLIRGPVQIQRIFAITRLDDRLEFIEPPGDA